jgi:hypothetical protein
MKQHISGKLERIGVQVSETFALRLEPDDGQNEEFRKDPRGFVRRFLEQEGFEVNRIQFLRPEHRGSPAARASALEGEGPVEGEGPWELRMIDTTFHIVYPPNEASGWICCCA